MSVDDRLRELATRSAFGVFTLPEAAAAGVDRFTVAEACRRGVLRRVVRGMYADADGPPHDLEPYAVPQRYLDRFRPPRLDGSEAALTGLASLDVRTGTSTGSDRPVVALPRDRLVRLRRPPFEVLRVPWDQVRATVVRGLRVVDVPQGIADAIRTPAHAEDVAVRALVDGVRQRLRLSMPHVVDGWIRLGTAPARRLLAMEAEGVWEQESDGERRAFQLLFAGGPEPDCQVVVLGAFRADFVYVDAGIIIEYDGREAHERRWEADLTRRMALEQAGWRVLVVTAAMLREAARLAAYIRRERYLRRQLIAEGRIPQPQLPPQPARMRPLRTLPPGVAVAELAA